MLEVKRISSDDRTRVLEIAAKIWEDDDYIPAVFDDWVADATSVFAGAFQEKYLIGFGRMSNLGSRNYWLEGLRKDPDADISGVGKAISAYMFVELKKMKFNTLRFSTYFDNQASVKLNEKRGFERILTLSLKMRDLKTTTENFENIDTLPALEELKSYLKKSSYLKMCKGFIAKGWVVYPYNEELIKSLLEQDKIAVYRKEGKICGAIISTDTHYEKEWWISLLDGDSAEIIKKLLSFADAQAKKKNKVELLVLLPENCLQKEVCIKDGFGSWEQEKDFFLYELPRDKF